jgi:hypothetical protein
MHRIT